MKDNFSPATTLTGELKFHTFLFAVITALSTMAHSIVAPLLPLYARELDIAPTQIGLLISLFGFVRFATQPFLGVYSDRWGHKKFIQGMLILFFVSGIGYSAGNSFPTLILFRIVQAIAAGGLSISVRAYIVEITNPGNRGRVNGFISSMQNAGSLLGPVLGGVIADVLTIRAPFYLLSFSILVCFLFSIKLPISSKSVFSTPKHGQTPATVKWSGSLKLLGVIHFMEFMGLGIWLAVWPIYANENLGWSGSLIGASFSISAFASLITAPLWGRLTDRHGRTTSAIAGLVLLIIQPIAVVVFRQMPILLWPIFALAGAGGTGYFNAYFTLVGDLSPSQSIGRVQGVLGSSSQLGNALGSLLAPVLWQVTSMQFTFWGDAVLLGGCALLFLPLFFKEKEKKLFTGGEFAE